MTGRRALSTLEDTGATEAPASRVLPQGPCPPWWRFVGLAVLCACTLACGKKGPPLAPLVRVPVAPVDFTAERRGDEVKLRFRVPVVNTDGTRPANIARVDVYGFTGAFTANDDQVIKFGTKVATVSVKAPKNADLTTEPDEPAEEVEFEDDGVDQGAIAQFEDPLTAEAQTPVELPKTKAEKAADRLAEAEVKDSSMLPETPRSVPWRFFMAIGVNKNGKRGPSSNRVVVPLVPPPAPPEDLRISYEERAISLTWASSPSWAPVQPRATDGLLAARYFGMEVSTLAYQVYDVSPVVSATPPATSPATAAVPAAPPATVEAGPPGPELRLTGPLDFNEYVDSRMDWGATRCYTVRAIETITGQTLESDAPPPVCVTLTDTFPPPAPKDLRLIATEGAISLIWEPSAAPDLAGYRVLRGTMEGVLTPITPAPVTDTTFTDTVPAGTPYWYAVEAVDRAGNTGPESNSVEGLAR